MEGFIGEIRIFAGNYAPVNWAICNGITLQTNEYPELYSLIGNTYEGSNTTFNLPDFRGRIVIGQGTGPGLTQRYMGEKNGFEYVKLKANNLPSHRHTVQANIGGISSNVPSSNTFLGEMLSPDAQVVGYLPYSATTPQNVELDYRTIMPEGGDGKHYNVMPCVGINYIICIKQNIYPPHQS